MFKSAKTVSAVMAAFNKTISELRDVAEAQQAEADKQQQIITAAQAAKAGALAEAGKAKAIGNKLEALISEV